jgi:hypothetical protein
MPATTRRKAIVETALPMTIRDYNAQSKDDKACSPALIRTRQNALALHCALGHFDPASIGTPWPRTAKKWLDQSYEVEPPMMPFGLETMEGPRRATAPTDIGDVNRFYGTFIVDPSSHEAKASARAWNMLWFWCMKLHGTGLKVDRPSAALAA